MSKSALPLLPPAKTVSQRSTSIPTPEPSLTAGGGVPYAPPDDLAKRLSMSNPPIIERQMQVRSYNVATLVALLSSVVVAAFFVGNAWARIPGIA